MQKLLYIPFPSMLAGGLAKGLEWSERIQVGLAKTKAEKGEYRGFKYGDRLFAPPKNGDKYVVPSPQKMTTFLAEEDFIYVNAHCNRGIGTLSLDEKCESKQKVTPEDLVAQLVAHGLPATSRSRMKLWACHAGLDAGAGKPSFAELFSTAMFGAGYETLRIFAYTESLMAQYDTVDEDHKPVNAHKHANARESQEDKLRKVIAAMKSPNAATTVPKLPMKQAVWGQIVKGAANDEERALRELLNDTVKVQLFVGAEKAELATVGARASKFRREFKNGVVVGHGKATSG